MRAVTIPPSRTGREPTGGRSLSRACHHGRRAPRSPRCIDRRRRPGQSRHRRVYRAVRRGRRRQRRARRRGRDRRRAGTVTAKAVAHPDRARRRHHRRLAVTPGHHGQAGQVLAVIDSPSARQRLRRPRDALAARKSTGGGGAAASNLAARRRRPTTRPRRRSTPRAGRVGGGRPDGARPPCSPRSTRPAAAVRAAAAARAAGQLGAARHRPASRQAVAALGAAQRAQAQAAYDLAQSTVDALTLRAPIAGVVQLGGARPASARLAQRPARPVGAAAAARPARPAAAAGGGRRTGPGSTTRSPSAARSAPAPPIVTIVDVSRARSGRRGRRDRRAAGPAGRHRRRSSWTRRPGATLRGHRRARSTCCRRTSARGGVAYRVAADLGAGRYADGRPAPDAPAGHERGGAPAGPRGHRRGDRAGRGGVHRRRPATRCGWCAAARRSRRR